MANNIDESEPIILSSITGNEIRGRHQDPLLYRISINVYKSLAPCAAVCCFMYPKCRLKIYIICHVNPMLPIVSHFPCEPSGVPEPKENMSDDRAHAAHATADSSPPSSRTRVGRVMYPESPRTLRVALCSLVNN